MSSPDPDLPPVAFQVAVISTGLNSILFLAFLMGIYTTAYFGTVYLYVTRKTSQTRVVTATITLLYVLNMAQLALSWQLSQSIYVESGVTRETIFNATFFTAAWATFASQIFTAAANILADGLLIWRCYYAWGQSLFAISLPLFFLVAETGLYAGAIIFFSAVKLAPRSERQGMIVNCLTAAGYFATFFSTISSTLLIVYRIYHTLSQQDNFSKKRFLQIVDVLVQSAAIYALALLVVAIVDIVYIASGRQTTLPMFAVTSYECGAIVYFVSGMAPTVMVARVALATDTTVVVNSTNVHISGLQFQGNSGIDSDINGGMNNAVAIGQSSQKSEKPAV